MHAHPLLAELIIFLSEKNNEKVSQKNKIHFSSSLWQILRNDELLFIHNEVIESASWWFQFFKQNKKKITKFDMYHWWCLKVISLCVFFFCRWDERDNLKAWCNLQHLGETIFADFSWSLQVALEIQFNTEKEKKEQSINNNNNEEEVTIFWRRKIKKKNIRIVTNKVKD